MIRSSVSDWVTDLFAASVCDWTPEAARSAVHLLYAPVTRNAQASRHCSAILSDAEVQRAGRIVTEEGKAQFKQRRAFRRYCGALALRSSRPLERIEFKETEKGRPYLPEAPDLWFSFSACRHGLLGAWSSTHAVGVDIEDSTRQLEAAQLARRYFLEAEARAVARADAPACTALFFKLWTLKEAALKSIGEGLPYGLDAFGFELTPGLRIVRSPNDHGGSEHFDAHILGSGADTCAAVVIRTRYAAA